MLHTYITCWSTPSLCCRLLLCSPSCCLCCRKGYKTPCAADDLPLLGSGTLLCSKAQHRVTLGRAGSCSRGAWPSIIITSHKGSASGCKTTKLWAASHGLASGTAHQTAWQGEGHTYLLRTKVVTCQDFCGHHLRSEAISSWVQTLLPRRAFCESQDCTCNTICNHAQHALLLVPSAYKPFGAPRHGQATADNNLALCIPQQLPTILPASGVISTLPLISKH